METPSISPLVIFKLSAWKALTESFLLWSFPRISSFPKLSLLGSHALNLRKSRATSLLFLFCRSFGVPGRKVTLILITQLLTWDSVVVGYKWPHQMFNFPELLNCTSGGGGCQAAKRNCLHATVINISGLFNIHTNVFLFSIVKMNSIKAAFAQWFLPLIVLLVSAAQFERSVSQTMTRVPALPRAWQRPHVSMKAS